MCVLRMSFEPQKLRSTKFWQYSHLNVICDISRHDMTGSMALLRYFSKASEVEKLDPQGALAKDILSSPLI